MRAQPALLWPLAAAAVALFIMLVVRQRRARARLHDLQLRIDLCRTGSARHARDWTHAPVVLPAGEDADHPFAADLELFGRPALTQLCGPVHTLHGARTLRAWLATPAAPAEIRRRQQAVQQLAQAIDFREELAVATHATPGAGHERLDRFIAWVEGVRLPRIPAPLVWLARLLPALTLTLAALQLFDVVARAWWLLPLAASALIAGTTLRRIYRTFDAAFARDPAPLRYARAFRTAAGVPGEGELLAQLRARLHKDGAPVADRIRRLERIMLFADVRHSGTASALLEVFFLWSLHVLLALGAWQDDARAELADWFAALGTLEALASLATLAHDQPDWCFPDIDPAAEQIEAQGIGHPMLRDDVRVTNDVALGPRGTLLLVTGSNMSGKSTLLRAVGVNTVLAQAGAPVCARAWRAPPLRLYTSLNVRDSLAAGVSLYLAQLRRIRSVLDAAEADAPELCCYLLDEILSGTNSHDRTTAVRAIVHRLLALPAIGALATHDLALAEDPVIAAAAQSIHFRETIEPGSGAMTFDYRLRAGQLRTTNALALLAMMGIRAEDAS